MSSEERNEKFENEKISYMIEVFTDSEHKIERLKVFSNKIGSYSHWNFHKNDIIYVKQLLFLFNTIFERLRSHVYFIHLEPQAVPESKHKIKNLLLTLYSIKAISNYDCENKEALLPKLTYYNNKFFEVNHSPCNDLEYFAKNSARLLNDLVNLEVGSKNQLEKFHSEYKEIIQILIDNLTDLYTFLIISDRLGDRRRCLYRSIYSHIRDGFISAVNSCGIDHMMMKVESTLWYRQFLSNTTVWTQND